MSKTIKSVSGEGVVTATTTEGVENNIHKFEYEFIDCTYNEETQTLTVGNSICVTGVSKDKVGEAVSNLLDISNTYGYIMGDYGDVISANSDTLTVKKYQKWLKNMCIQPNKRCGRKVSVVMVKLIWGGSISVKMIKNFFLIVKDIWMT